MAIEPVLQNDPSPAPLRQFLNTRTFIAVACDAASGRRITPTPQPQNPR
jgi:hypothetical protein